MAYLVAQGDRLLFGGRVYRPGDEVPAREIPKTSLAALVAAGIVVEVAEPGEDPAGKKPRRRERAEEERDE